MKEYEFQGTFTYVVQADSLDEARERLDDDLGSVVWGYRVENTYE